MTPRALLREAAERLRLEGIPDPEVDASLLLAYVTGGDSLALRLDDRPLSEKQEAVFRALLEKRLTRAPLQYILGDQPFMGRSFRVDTRALIPRPETELLVERALNALTRCEVAHPLALDLCCGSGCIAATLALDAPRARVHASDLSPDALALARENCRALSAPVTLHEGDLFAPVSGLQFDVIVSNPPYIPSGACDTLQPEVLREPRMALDGGADGLAFYRRIAAEAPDRLAPGGVLLLEVGDGEAEAVRDLLASRFPHVAVYPDLRQMPRMVEAAL